MGIFRGLQLNGAHIVVYRVFTGAEVVLDKMGEVYAPQQSVG